MAIGGAVLLALKAPVTKLAYLEGMTPLSVMAYRAGLSMPVFGLILAYQLRTLRAPLSRRDLTHIIIVGIFGFYFASFFDFAGLQYITAQLERLTLFTYPMIVVALGAAFARRWPSKEVIVALGLGYTGVALVLFQDLSRVPQDEHYSDTLYGVFLVFLASLCFTVYMMASRTMIVKFGSVFFTSIATLASGGIIFVHVGLQSTFWSTEAISLSLSAKAWGLMVIMAGFCTLLPLFMIAAAIGYMGPGRTSITALVGPVATSFFAVWLLGEAFTGYHLGALLLLAVGIGVMSRSSPPKGLLDKPQGGVK